MQCYKGNYYPKLLKKGTIYHQFSVINKFSDLIKLEIWESISKTTFQFSQIYNVVMNNEILLKKHFISFVGFVLFVLCVCAAQMLKQIPYIPLKYSL